MNYYAILPVISFFANMTLGCYILYRNPKDKLNRLFSLFAFSLAAWALGDILVFTSSTPESALYWSKLLAFGVALMPAFLLHFFLVFTNKKIVSKKIFHMVLYMPSLFFIFVSLTTNLVTESADLCYWGYATSPGILRFPFTMYGTGYVVASLLLCHLYLRTSSPKEKIQTKLFIVAIGIPLVGGIITEVVSIPIGAPMMPLTTTLTTISAVIIAYAITRHKLMATKSFSIYKKLVASFLIVIVLVLNVGFFSVSQSRELSEESIGTGSILIISEIMDKIDRTIYNRVEEFQLRVDSSNYGFQELIEKSNQEFSALGSEQDVYDYINEKDIEWISTLKNETTPFMEDLLNNNISRRLNKNIEFYEGKYNYSLFGEIFVTNKYGANVGQTGRTTDYYQANEEWWQNGREDGLYIGEVDYDKSADIYSIDIVARIDDENGDFIGVLKAVWNIEEITRGLQESKLSEEIKQYESMCCLLLDSSGRLIYSTEEFEFLEDKSDMLPSFSEHHGEEGTYFITSDSSFGEGEKLVSHIHSSGLMDLEGLDWVLIIEYDTEDIFASVYNLWNVILFVSCIIIIISLSFGYVISRSISKPIIRLRDAAKEIGRGKLDTEINVKTNDEVGYLASAFSQMASSLQKQQETLEEAVAERTKELETKVDELERFKKIVVGRELKMVELKNEIKELSTKLKEGHFNGFD